MSGSYYVEAMGLVAARAGTGGKVRIVLLWAEVMGGGVGWLDCDGGERPSGQ